VSKIEAADGLKAQVKAALAREAEASLAADAALKEFSGKLFAFSPHAPPDPGMAKQAFRALYYTVKKGVNTIEAMRADAKFVAAIGDITRITATERAELETAFDEVKELVKLGQAKSMDENSLLGYIDRWAINRENATFRPKLLEDMNAWKPLTAEQTKALEAVAEQKGVVTDLYKEEQSLLAEREELAAKQRDPATRTEENREQLQSINERLGELDPKYKRQTYKQRVTTTNAQGEVAEHYVDVPIKHPPGEIAQAETHLSAVEKAAADSQLSLYDRLRAAAPSAAARERTLKGVSVDQVGPLKTTATPLEAEHIVSVREIADMDGFADLPWKDQKEIADMRINLVAMDGSANGSKGSRTWRSWNQASAYYDQSTIDAMIAREANARAAIKAEISARLHPLPKH